MKVLFIGLGSVGKRHLKILSQLGDYQFISCPSGFKRRPHAFYSNYNIVSVSGLESAIEKAPDFAVIANPTAFHIDSALRLAKAGIPLLIEKPVSNRLEGLDDLLTIVTEKKLPVLVGFQRRFHPGYRLILKNVLAGEIGRPLNLQGYVGQYLPDWRPKDDYRKNYSAISDLGGGVILDLCHEIDIATSLLGSVRRVGCICTRNAELEIETEAIADITLLHEAATTSHIHLNYLDRIFTWHTRVLGTRGTITWDHGNGFVELIRDDGVKKRWTDPPDFQWDWMFRDQLLHWLNVLKGLEKPLVNLKQGIDVTRVALAAHRSSREQRHIDFSVCR